jgi:hypothetical protein
VESMKMMGGGGTKFTYTQYTSTAQTWPLCAQPDPL